MEYLAQYFLDMNGGVAISITSPGVIIFHIQKSPLEIIFIISSSLLKL